MAMLGTIGNINRKPRTVPVVPEPSLDVSEALLKALGPSTIKIVG
jgi:hypothetical protein